MPSFGTHLKEERERRKISLDEISASTKISTRLLHALEDDHFELLPGGIFNKGFIRAYAQYLGLDEEQVISEYLEASGALPAEEKAEGSVPAAVVEIRTEVHRNESAGLPWGLLAVALLIVAIGFTVWGFRGRGAATNNTQGPENSAPPPPVPASPAPSQAPAPMAGNSTVSAVSTDANRSSSTKGVAKTPAAVPAAASFVVRISAREDSWLSITADDKRVLQDTLLASTEKSVQASKEIIVRAGNIGALDFEWNGQKLPPQGEEGQVMTLSFDAKGWHAAAKPAPEPEPATPF